jgi:hypothetical protein
MSRELPAKPNLEYLKKPKNSYTMESEEGTAF